MTTPNRIARREYREKIEAVELEIEAVELEIEARTGLIAHLRDTLLDTKALLKQSNRELFRFKKLLAKVPPEQIPTREEDLTALAIRQSEQDRKAAGIPASDRYATERYADRGNAGRPPIGRSPVTEILGSQNPCEWKTVGVDLEGEYSDLGPDASITGLPAPWDN